jgi:NTE family protein
VKRAILLAALLLSACAHAPLNEPLTRANIETGYRYANVTLPREDDTFIVLTFSGGGSRAAGFSYGVLRQLEQVRFPDGTTLLDRVDLISSVSGGSFMSTYYGLHGREGLGDFKTRFLDRNIEGMLIEAAINPKNIVRLLSPRFSRIDLAAELYDRVLFDNKTYADLHAVQAAKKRPFIVVNSTELDLGSRFEWTQDQFDPICSDLSKTHVSRAVAASSAFPVLLTPMTLKDYAGSTDCGFVMPSWVANARQDLETNASRHRNAVELEAYRNPQRPWLHLMDGGIADNIGLRGTLHAMVSTDTFQMDDPARRRTGYTLQPELNRRTIKRLLVIVVNAATESDLNFDRKQSNPKLAQILGAISFTPMKNFSFDTVQQLTAVMNEYSTSQSQPVNCQNAVKSSCPDVRIPGAERAPVAFYPVILGFSGVQDATLRRDLNAIGTNFALKPGQLELLERAAKDLLAGSEAFQQFLSDSGGTR